MNVKSRVFVTREIMQEALDLIDQHADMEVWPDEEPPSPEILREKVAGAQGVLTNIMDRVDTQLLDAAPGLKVVSQLAVGLDNVDVAGATARGIPVGYTPGVLAKATADVGFALLMSAARRIGESDRWVRDGQWTLAFHPMRWLGVDIHEKTLGISRPGSDRPGNGPPGSRLRHADHLPLPHSQAGAGSRVWPGILWTCQPCWPRRTLFPCTCR